MNEQTALSRLESALKEQKLSASAAANIRRWLTEPRYAEYAPQVAEHIAAKKWKELDDVFWTVIPFGTGGRRGRMYPIGCNAINERTIGESAQGLAEYVLRECRMQNAECRVAESESNPQSAIRNPQSSPPSCAIAYDTRHNSRLFAELCASIMVANGFQVYFLDDYRSTPELSFLVRHKNCSCGIMVTASHNPPSDNAVKVYWSTGGQVVPPHDRGIVDRVMNVAEIKRVDFQQAVSDGRIVLCQKEIDEEYVKNVVRHSSPGRRDVRILYSPLHGVGASSVGPVLFKAGFKDGEIYAPHSQLDGDFPRVPGHAANPENPDVFDMLISRAVPAEADIALATDPDCDRMGCAAPRFKNRKGFWGTFTGNQLAALLTDFVCGERQKAGTLTPDHFLVTTLVTTPMVRRIGEHYGIKTFDNVHVGFKWIAQEVDAQGPDKFVFGTEESHGFMIGQYVRDKDGAAACMLMAELAAQMKASGKTLFDRLESLYWRHGYHAERQVSIFMTGSAGMARMQALMERLRKSAPASLGGIAVRQLRDYRELTVTSLKGKRTKKLDAPKGDMVILDLAEEGHFVAVRPSGTEPKVKFYLFTFVAPGKMQYLDDTAREMYERLNNIEKDLRELAEAC
jgi:phosphoglucomutase/phosphomannomutase